jgi:hypothetical protein
VTTPIFSAEWGADEELLLLEGIESEFVSPAQSKVAVVRLFLMSMSRAQHPHPLTLTLAFIL